MIYLIVPTRHSQHSRLRTLTLIRGPGRSTGQSRVNFSPVCQPPLHTGRQARKPWQLSHSSVACVCRQTKKTIYSETAHPVCLACFSGLHLPTHHTPLSCCHFSALYLLDISCSKKRKKTVMHNLHTIHPHTHTYIPTRLLSLSLSCLALALAYG